MINRRVYYPNSFDLKDIVIGRGYRVFQNCNFEQMKRIQIYIIIVEY